MRIEIMKSVLNAESIKRGFSSWEDMKCLIPPFQAKFIEDCIMEALGKVNWQGVLR